MVDDQLGASSKQIDEFGRAIRSCKALFLLKLDHWQPTSLGVDPIAVLGVFFLVLKEYFTRVEPFVVPNNAWMCYFVLNHCESPLTN
jgi:hypothetical protein